VSDLRWAFRQRLARGEAPGEVLGAVNDWLIGQSVHELLVTALCIRIDVPTGMAEIASAGHLGPFVKRWTGGAEAVTPAPAALSRQASGAPRAAAPGWRSGPKTGPCAWPPRSGQPVRL